MAKNWYPVIDYTLCIECGTCVAKCPHNVYDTAKAPSSVIKNPESCIDHCHGCGNYCLVGAITYVGDNTGWTPPNGKGHEVESCCSCGCGTSTENIVMVEYLYLDLKTCDRCIGTDSVLNEVLITLAPVLKLAGYKVEFKKIEIKTAELAERYQFLSSPTIRIKGHDICKSVKENGCGCCSEISGRDIDCRLFEYKGAGYEIPPKEMLAEAILKAIFGTTSEDDCGRYELPDNLKVFFEGKNNKLA
ncbi:MAG: DUF2703 domain-containing protein [Lachnospiraceae bacterium]|nr:DUF2703 domain-containing protein [Lachnospiraceae bacterium]